MGEHRRRKENNKDDDDDNHAGGGSDCDEDDDDEDNDDDVDESMSAISGFLSDRANKIPRDLNTSSTGWARIRRRREGVGVWLL